MPAQSPTLSPTLSAIVAGLRGSSSGMPGFDLAHEVGADVGRLGEDAAADAQEQREQRATEAEADEDRGRGVLEDHDDDGGAEQAEADREHAGDAAGAERDLERGRAASPICAAAAVRTLPRTARLMPMKPVSPESTQPAMNASVRNMPGLRERQPRRRVRPAISGLTTSVDVTNTTIAERDQDHGDRLELPPQVGHRAFLDRRGDLDHRRRALVGGEDAAHQVEADGDREQRGDAPRR